MRILILLAIGLLLYIIIGSLIRKSKMTGNTTAGSSERMVRCEHCGLHIVEKEALQDNQQYFCSREHLEAHRQSQ
ncbi:MAG: hypothetical protein Kow0083_01960 [Methylophaga sp.]|jgi:uncharacterized protein